METFTLLAHEVPDHTYKNAKTESKRAKFVLVISTGLALSGIYLTVKDVPLEYIGFAILAIATLGCITGYNTLHKTDKVISAFHQDKVRRESARKVAIKSTMPPHPELN